MSDAEDTNDDIDISPLMEYLKTNQGHEVASRILTIFEDVKKATIENSTRHAKFEKWIQASIVLVVVLATSVLTYFQRFDASVGVLFGTLVGYLFGKR